MATVSIALMGMGFVSGMVIGGTENVTSNNKNAEQFKEKPKQNIAGDKREAFP